MPESTPPATLDTSVVVAALLAEHPQHRLALPHARAADALPAHVLLEAFRVLTALPHGLASPAAAVADALRATFPGPVLTLPARRHPALLQALAAAGAGGGAVYDAVVAAEALAAGRALVSADRRAAAVYALVGVEVVWLQTTAR